MTGALNYRLRGCMWIQECSTSTGIDIPNVCLTLITPGQTGAWHWSLLVLFQASRMSGHVLPDSWLLYFDRGLLGGWDKALSAFRYLSHCSVHGYITVYGSLMELLVKNLQVACMFSVFSYFSQILTPSWTYVAAAFASVGSTNPGVLCVCNPGVLCVCMALCLYAVNNTTIIACSHYITVASFDIAFNQHTHLYAMLDTCVHW